MVAVPLPHSCRNCQHFQPRAGLEPPHCRADPRKENLKSFPFRKTNCIHWVLAHVK